MPGLTSIMLLRVNIQSDLKEPGMGLWRICSSGFLGKHTF